MSLISILLQAAGAGQSQWSGILMMVVVVAIFYFFMIRPQQKKQKEIQKAREALQTGDKVITSGGIYGKIKEIGDIYMLIEIADGVRIRVDKTSVFASSEDAQQK
ncbi:MULTISPECIES: preprotein translocase subunit YajC [Parabacteroides]|uniref:preprotein translocase subunit YajC n=1 Tax=Parabacteroides provencensis TaxID=1944636 RepID=UPI000C15FD45|nr:preprotein translocase subunit YajC [Parabacteroides provencensis]